MPCTTENITQHFTWAEAACHDGTPVPDDLQDNARRLALLLEQLRQRFGGAIVPLSWYRTPQWNVRVGGALHSQHLIGKAADIRPANLRDLPGLQRCVEAMIAGGELVNLGGFGVYPAWLHVDIRRTPPDGHIARWTGGGVGAEQ